MSTTLGARINGESPHTSTEEEEIFENAELSETESQSRTTMRSKLNKEWKQRERSKRDVLQRIEQMF